MKHFYGLRKYGFALLQRMMAHEERAYVPNPYAQFQERRSRAVKAGDRLLCAISDELTRAERSRLESRLEHLYSLFDIVQMADEATRFQREDKPSAPAEESVAPDYLVSSLFLADCHTNLLSNPHGHERLHLVTGIKVSAESRTLERMVQVALSSQSAIHAKAEQHDLQKILIELDERWGHFLHGLFHSHPRKGVSATQPSTTDLTTHQRYEHGGYPLVGAIFVKDGFVRFFAHHPFTITIYGKGVEQIHEHVFAIRNLPHQAP